ncbi:LmeA family phospholipid-binding protein [Egbenema bharatensis]|uniref:LmeA family phospholipid-binding protein n=1 Tax=Egbenema bharatensis TaxID=3463334 RepID=UPI003A8C6380
MSRLISKVLSPAVKLWLRSQVNSVETLQFQIEGGDRQLMSGNIPKVTIAAQQVIYQGIALSYIHLVGETIRVNLKEVVRGKPLRLLEPIPVQIETIVHQADLNASMNSPLLAEALSELVMLLLQSGLTADLPVELQSGLQPPIAVQSPAVKIGENYLTLSANLRSTSTQQITLFILRTQLQIAEGQKIRFLQPEWLTHPDAETGQPLPHLETFEIDLGAEVFLQQLTLNHEELICQGQIQVMP